MTSGLAGLGSSLLAAAPPAWAFKAQVQMIGKEAREFDFNPRLTQIFIGDRVQWHNDTAARHTVTSDPGSPVAFDSGEIAAGSDFERRFQQVGTYAYHCKIHDQMKGVVEVTDPNAPTTTTAPPTTTTTAPPPTTTTTARPTTTTTTEPPTTTTTTAPRPPAGIEPPPVPATAAAPPSPPPPPPLASSSTTTVPSSTTTTVPPTTVTTGPPPPAGEQPAPPTSAPGGVPSTEAPPPPDTGDEMPTAAGPSSGRDGKTDPATVALVSALVAVGLFGAWTLIRVRPGRV
ncbi:MAG: plastocyanin/azurin family copper-binding protein [Actinomycetota bacterium]